MIIKRYIVSNMNEAMTRIRYELGKEAVIISQRKIKRPGFKGFFLRKAIEVTAAVENIKKNEYEVSSSIEALKKVAIKEGLVSRKDNENFGISKKYQEAKEVESVENTDGSDNNIIKEMQELKSLISEMVSKTPGKSTGMSKIQTKLEDSDVSHKVIIKVLDKVKALDDDIDELKKVRLVIEKMVTISKAEMKGPVVLVGPTGVGKTTTIAKLAGRLSLIEKKKVGLITIDTYRIGAVEQLKTYADIMNIPFKVVFTINEMENAVLNMQDCDVVLIDTTGRSCKNAMQISELRAFIEKINTDNIHLVLSCTTKNKDLESIIQGYSVLGYNNIIITKLDETSIYGPILNILDFAKRPLSFVTTGQNVPEDIKCISASEVSSLILGEDSVC